MFGHSELLDVGSIGSINSHFLVTTCILTLLPSLTSRFPPLSGPAKGLSPSQRGWSGIHAFISTQPDDCDWCCSPSDRNEKQKTFSHSVVWLTAHYIPIHYRMDNWTLRSHSSWRSESCRTAVLGSTYNRLNTRGGRAFAAVRLWRRSAFSVRSALTPEHCKSLLNSHLFSLTSPAKTVISSLGNSSCFKCAIYNMAHLNKTDLTSLCCSNPAPYTRDIIHNMTHNTYTSQECWMSSPWSWSSPIPSFFTV